MAAASAAFLSADGARDAGRIAPAGYATVPTSTIGVAGRAARSATTNGTVRSLTMSTVMFGPQSST